LKSLNARNNKIFTSCLLPSAIKIAMDVFDIGIEPVVLTDCCASTAGLQAHLAGLSVLSRNIGAQRLRDAGLSEGFLAAL
jgi:hypothetical protein